MLPEHLAEGERVPLSVKREEQQENTLTGMRKRMLRKIYSIFKDTYNLPISDSKDISLQLEEKVNTLYPNMGSVETYIDCFKRLFKKLKVTAANREQRDQPQNHHQAELPASGQVQQVHRTDELIILTYFPPGP